MLGQKLNARVCFEELEMIENIGVSTRTHVYAYLLKPSATVVALIK
jgi:hypothetical protein